MPGETEGLQIPLSLLPDDFTEAMRKAQKDGEASLGAIARAQKEAAAAGNLHSREIAALEKGVLKGSTAFQKTAIELARVRALHVGGAEAAKLQAAAEANLEKVLGDQVRRAQENKGRSISKLFDELRESILKTNPALGTAQKAISAVTGASGAGAASIGMMLGTVGLLGGAALAAAGGMAALGVRTYEQIDAIDDLAARTGTTAQELSKFRYMSSQTDVELSTFGDVLKHLSMAMLAAQDPTSEQARLFRALNVETTDASGSLRAGTDVMRDLVGAYQHAGSESDKLAISVKLLGKSGNEFLPVLNLQKAAFDELISTNKALNLEIDEHSLQAAGRYEQVTKELKAGFEGWAESIGARVLPMMARLGEALSETLGFRHQTEITRLQKGIDQLGTVIEVQLANGAPAEAVAKLREEMTRLLAKQKELTDATAQAKAAEEGFMGPVISVTERLKRQADADDEAKKTKEATAAATKKQAAEEKALAKEIEAATRATAEGYTAQWRKQQESLEEFHKAVAEDEVRGQKDTFDILNSSLAFSRNINLKDLESTEETERKKTEARKKSAELSQQAWTDSFASIGQSAKDVSDLIIKFSKKQGDAAEQAAVIAFRVSQAASIINITMSTAEAVMKALATIPAPASYAVAAGMVLAGATQAAIVLAQDPPTSAGGGSFQSASPSMSAGAGITSNRVGGAAYTAADADTQAEAAVSARSSRSRSDEIVVTDAHFPASSRSRLVRVAPGDEFDARRGGALGGSSRTDPRSLAAMAAQLQETQGLRRDIQAMTAALMARNHWQAAAGPAGTL